MTTRMPLPPTARRSGGVGDCLLRHGRQRGAPGSDMLPAVNSAVIRQLPQQCFKLRRRRRRHAQSLAAAARQAPMANYNCFAKFANLSATLTRTVVPVYCDWCSVHPSGVYHITLQYMCAVKPIRGSRTWVGEKWGPDDSRWSMRIKLDIFRRNARPI